MLLHCFVTISVIKTIKRTTQIHQPITFNYFEHQPITVKIGGAYGDRENTKKTIFVAKKSNFFGKKVFSGERFIWVILHELQYGYLSSKPYVKGELFPLSADTSSPNLFY